MSTVDNDVEHPAFGWRTSQIRTKAEFYALWQAGLLGNRPRSWRTLSALRASGYEGAITLRYTGTAGGGMAVTHVRTTDVPRVVNEWVLQGSDPGRITFNESMPDHMLVLQGEVQRGIGGFDLTYSTEADLPMRQAMRRPKLASGLTAKLIVDQVMDPSSRDDLESLLSLYPDAVVEFGSYARDVGVFPGRNTVFWEIRNY